MGWICEGGPGPGEIICHVAFLYGVQCRRRNTLTDYRGLRLYAAHLDTILCRKAVSYGFGICIYCWCQAVRFKTRVSGRMRIMLECHAIYSLFEEKWRKNPDAVAVFDEQRRLTREELYRLIDTIALLLPENVKRAGIVMDHSVEMIAAIFAVLKVGAAYIPVEPSFPEDRICFMMRDAGADCIITEKKFAEKMRGFPLVYVERGIEMEDAGMEARSGQDDLAYILYTSGSTGKPKGVSVLNRNVCHYVRAFQNEFHPEKGDIMLQYSVCSFDIFVEEVFPILLSDAVLAIPSEKTKAVFSDLMEFVETNCVTMISGFPYLLVEMNRLPKLPGSLRLLISGGDVLRASYIDRLLGQVDVYNTYGPSETTVCASYFRCNGAKPLEDGTYPVGKAVLGTRIAILDDNLLPVGAGQTGEICIMGGGVSEGYTGDRKKENEAFLTMPDGSRLYRSGDLGRALPDGNISFLCRKDMQVMILGKRVEPVEVESAICNCPEIEKAVVKPYVDEQSSPYLVAYVVWKDRMASLSSLKKKLAKFLPSYMIPEFFIRMKELPLNPNGKPDMAALPVIMKEGIAV